MSIAKYLDPITKKKVIRSSIASSIIAVIIVSTVVITMYPQMISLPQFERNSNYIQINHNVPNAFAEFIPYSVNITPNAPQYTVAEDLSNVIGVNLYNLDSGTISMIAKNYFAVKLSNFNDSAQIYQDNYDKGYPTYITVDSIIHAYHVLYDYSLRVFEFYNSTMLIQNLTEKMVEQSLWLSNQFTNETLKELALRDAAFFAVAMKLFNPDWEIPAQIKSIVEAQVALIEEHNGLLPSPIFGYIEDYSQYVPRGHYTRTEALMNYFKGMMWYGRMHFDLRPGEFYTEIKAGQNMTLMAIMITHLMETNQVLGVDCMDIWNLLSNVIDFFVGTSDDLTLTEYSEIMHKVYGNIELSDFEDTAKLNEFIKTALTYRSPKICSYSVGEGTTENETKGFRFFGQRYIPDSYMFQQLVYDNVGSRTTPRIFPKGLDILSVLGSVRAEQILNTTELKYDNYFQQILKLRDEIKNLNETTWVSNLYWLWIYSLIPMFDGSREGYPSFAQSAAWADRELVTALGSWTELRHDTILYAKQSYGRFTSPGGEVIGYVDPYPEVYGRLAALVDMTIRGLESRNIMYSEISQRLSLMKQTLLRLQEISIKELLGQSLNSSDFTFIANIGTTLSYLTDMSNVLPDITSEVDAQQVLVADVHTDTLTYKCLEEAIGKPSLIYVVVPINGKLYLARGATFTYYEFTWPINDRLTDEAWYGMVVSGNTPGLPWWTSSYIAESVNLFEPAP